MFIAQRVSGLLLGIKSYALYIHNIPVGIHTDI